MTVNTWMTIYLNILTNSDNSKITSLTSINYSRRSFLSLTRVRFNVCLHRKKNYEMTLLQRYVSFMLDISKEKEALRIFYAALL